MLYKEVNNHQILLKFYKAEIYFVEVLLVRLSRPGKIVVVFLVAVLAAGAFFYIPLAADASESVSVYLNGQKVSFDVEPIIENDRTLVPLRAVFEAVGADVQWDEATSTVLANREGTEVVLKIGSLQPLVNGQVWPLDVPAQIVNNRTLAPLRFVGEAFGGQVGWDAAARTVTITTSDTKEKVVIVSSSPVKLHSGPGNTCDILTTINIGEKMVVLAEEDNWYQINYSGQKGWVAGWLVEIVREEEQPETEISNSPAEIETPEVTDNSQWQSISIMGESMVSSTELKELALKHNPNAPDLAALYIKIGKEYGIRGDIAFCQAAKETGWWKYGGLVLPEQNNYCGLSATGKAAAGDEDLRGADPDRVWFEEGKHGAFFAAPETGVEAHIQHLYAYATAAPLPAGKELLDPRFILVTRGNSVNWEDLGGKWAVPGYDRNKYPDLITAFANCDTYGHSIINDYYKKVWQPSN